MTKLVILESPGKVKKVSQFLKKIDKDNNYIVKASIGHVRELADTQNYQIGVNMQTITPDFIVNNDKKKVVKELIDSAKTVNEVILATDPDREGEVIAWHLYDILKPYNDNFKRMRLNAITKECIKKELNNLDQINMKYVNAGLSRSYLDKITGYLLSRVLQDNSIGISAGRVQSSILKILSNREYEINNFIKEEWFILQDNLEVTFKNVNKISNEEDKFEVIKYKTFVEVINIKKQLDNSYIVKQILTTEFKDKPFINFTTSDYLQDAKAKLKLKVTLATNIAQSLYEKGLITYIRTDSTKLDKETENKLINFVIAKYGRNMLGPIHCKKDKETDQEGHPPITPTHFEWEPGDILKYCDEPLSEMEIMVYDLIWKNSINSALKQPFGNKNTYILENKNYLFLGETKEYIDYGYYSIDNTLTIPESQNFNWSINQKVNVISVQAVLQNSNPKSRFNEATLIKELERLSIGRPSTYKSSVEVNQKRNYVEVDKKDSMFVTNQGIVVNEFLEQNFNDFVNLEFTKNMEKDLDLIAKGQLDHKIYIKEYFQKIEKEAKKFMIEQIKCPKCQKGFIKQSTIKNGASSCSEYKTCGFKSVSENAPKCEGCENGKRYMVEYFDKKDNCKKIFETCTNYPKCKWVPGAIQKCGICNDGWLIERTKKDKTSTFIVCNNTKCDFIQF